VISIFNKFFQVIILSIVLSTLFIGVGLGNSENNTESGAFTKNAFNWFKEKINFSNGNKVFENGDWNYSAVAEQIYFYLLDDLKAIKDFSQIDIIEKKKDPFERFFVAQRRFCLGETTVSIHREFAQIIQEKNQALLKDALLKKQQDQQVYSVEKVQLLQKIAEGLRDFFKLSTEELAKESFGIKKIEMRKKCIERLKDQHIEFLSTVYAQRKKLLRWQTEQREREFDKWHKEFILSIEESYKKIKIL